MRLRSAYRTLNSEQVRTDASRVLHTLVTIAYVDQLSILSVQFLLNYLCHIMSTVSSKNSSKQNYGGEINKDDTTEVARLTQ